MIQKYFQKNKWFLCCLIFVFLNACDGTDTTTCTANSGCASPSFCNIATGQCVECVQCADTACNATSCPEADSCSDNVSNPTSAELFCANQQCYATDDLNVSTSPTQDITPLGLNTLCDAGQSCSEAGVCVDDADPQGCITFVNGTPTNDDNRCAAGKVCRDGVCVNLSQT